MTNLQIQIDESIKNAMKEQDVLKRETLKLLKGEISRGRVKIVSDAEISKIAKKLIDGIIETNSDNGEIKVLQSFVIVQMTNDELKSTIKDIIQESNSKKSMGEIMGFFRKNYEGQYDGKELSLMVSEMLT